MSDDRIERSLRAGPPDEPVWSPGRFAGRPPRRGQRWTGILSTLTTLALVLIFAIGIIVGRVTAAHPATPGASPSDLLGRVHASGILRVAVLPTFPQIQEPGGSYGGFDVDVAKGIASRLGLRVQIIVEQESDILRGGWHGRWDIALGTVVDTGLRRTLAFSVPYAYWPAIVSVRNGLPVSSPSDLAGRRICVVMGGFPEAWLHGTLEVESPLRIAAPPVAPEIVEAADEAWCIADETVLAWDAMVTDRTTPDILAERARSHVLPAPGFVEPTAVALDLAGPDPLGLRAEVDAAIAGMRADGTLARISRSDLGTDLSVVSGS